MRFTLVSRATLLGSLLVSLPCACFSQGFGSISKETVTLHRKLPALFPLTGTDVSVKVTATAANTSSLAQNLSPMIETMLQENDHRVTIENAKPQTLIACVITGYVPPSIQNLTRSAPITTKKGRQNPPQQYKKITGQLTVSYKAIDAKSRRTLDAAVLQTKINEDYEANGSKTASLGETWNKVKKLPHGFAKKHEAEEVIPATTEDVNQLMLRNIATDLAKRVVTTDESVEVLLAKGKLEHAGKLGQSGLWPRMLEEVEAVPPFPKREDEAYRLYDLGVAYEAMGYAAPDSKQAVKLFDRAAINYGKAIDDNPEEKYLREPQTRIQTALVVMRTLADRAKTGGAVVQEATAEGPKPRTTERTPISASETKTVTNSPGPPADPDTLTDDSIIELAKSGMNDENLIANIQDAKHVNFDLSISGQKQLMQEGVSNAVLAAMRQKAKGSVGRKRGPSAPAVASKAAPKSQP